MLSYLKKYNNLPGELRNKVSSPEVMAAIADMEKKYNVSLATVVMRVMVKDILMDDLAEYFNFEHDLNKERAEEMVVELKNKVFTGAIDYLKQTTDDRPAIANLEISEDKPSGEELAAEWMREKKEKAMERETDFYFSAEDEEEVMAMADKVKDYTKGEKYVAVKAEDGRAKQIREELDLNFSSEELNSRFSQVVKTYFSGVRKRIDTREALIRAVNDGGLGMDGDAADRVMAAADKIVQKLQPSFVKASSSAKATADKIEDKQTGKMELQEDQQAETKKSGNGVINGQEQIAGLKMAGVRDVAYDFKHATRNTEQTADASEQIPDEQDLTINLKEMDKPAPEEKASAEIGNDQKIEDGEDEIQKNKKAKKPSSAKAMAGKQESKIVDENGNDGGGSVQNVEAAKKFDHVKMDIPEIKRPIGAEVASAPAGKVKMEDVRYVPKLTGPVEELKDMDLINFRRLGDNPITAAAKIKDKIGFLDEESFGRRLAGIKAWRQSPVYNLYLKTGQESLGQEKPVIDVITNRKAAHKDYLTNHEFAAIMDLNKDLRF